MSCQVMTCIMCSLYCYAYYIIAHVWFHTYLNHMHSYLCMKLSAMPVSVNTGINSLMWGLWCISPLWSRKMSPYLNHTAITTWYLGMEFIIWNIRIWHLYNKLSWKRRTDTHETRNDWHKHLPSRWPLTCDLAKCYFVRTFSFICNLEIW